MGLVVASTGIRTGGIPGIAGGILASYASS